jgi:hypothetical protein
VWAGIVAAYAAPPAEPTGRRSGSRGTPPEGAGDRESTAPVDVLEDTVLDDGALEDGAQPENDTPLADGAAPVAEAPRSGSGATGFEDIRAELDERRRAQPAPIDPADDPTEHYIPPPPPPIPRGTLVTQAAWAGVLGGPLFLLLATLLGWDPGGTSGLLAVFAFVGGFITLAIHRSDDPPDQGDDGAVV